MNYNEEIDKIVANYQHPCDAEVPAGYYRRVMWEKYNTTLENKGPAVNEEWLTEVIPVDKRVYDKNPFGFVSDPLPYPTSTDPITGLPTDPALECTGVWSTKIGYCFTSQAELEQYVKDIGSTLIGNNWYGADLSKSNLFKNSKELELYKLENTGAIWTKSGPKVDNRTCMRYNDSTKSATLIDFDRSGQRTAYLKHYDDRPCTFVGMKVYPHADTSIPGLPIAVAVAAAALPIIAGPCLPISFGFPYSGISEAMMKAWNTTRHNFKLAFNGLAGLTEGIGDQIATMYDGLSVSMEELGNAALAMSQYALQMAWAKFTEVISTALNIVGGAWDMIKNFLPKITIAGISIDILELCTSPNGVQALKAQITQNVSQVIDDIYTVIGSSYRYAIEYVKMTARDIVDALTDLYDWAWCQLQMAGVALCKLLGDLAQIWSMPPIVPNPVWAAILAVRNILMQIKPLDVILSGNFPGFTAADLYDQCMAFIKEKRDQVFAQVELIEQQLREKYKEQLELIQEYKEKFRRFEQYKNGMWEYIKEETTEYYEQQLAELQAKIDKIKIVIDALNVSKEDLLKSCEDVFKMGMEQLKKLPIIAQVNEFLGMVGVGIDNIVDVVKNVTTGNSSLYKDFVDGCRALKDACKTIFNQIATLALSKVTQWVNKLLAIIGLIIQFPEVSFCVPQIEYPKLDLGEIP